MPVYLNITATDVPPFLQFISKIELVSIYLCHIFIPDFRKPEITQVTIKSWRIIRKRLCVFKFFLCQITRDPIQESMQASRSCASFRVRIKPERPSFKYFVSAIIIYLTAFVCGISSQYKPFPNNNFSNMNLQRNQLP